jgi:hypothetical protein
VTRFEKAANFSDAYAHATLDAPTIKTVALWAALLAYAVGA